LKRPEPAASDSGAVTVRLPAGDLVPNTLLPMKPSALMASADTMGTDGQPPSAGTSALDLYSPRVVEFLAMGGEVPFYVRAIPVNGAGRSHVVGKPTNIGRVMYGGPGPQRGSLAEVDWAASPRDAPQIALTELVYKPYRSDDRWPAGCKVHPGLSEAFDPLGFLMPRWDWAERSFATLRRSATASILAGMPVLPREPVETALDAALAMAGISPDVPNLDELIDRGAGYLAKAVAEQLAASDAGALIDELATEILGPTVALSTGQLGPDALRRKVQAEMARRIEQSLLDASQQARADSARTAGDTWCRTRHDKPVLEITVRNRTGAQYDDIWLEFGFDNLAFKGRTLPFDLGPYESLTIVTPLSPDLWAIAARYDVPLDQAMDKHFEIYDREPGVLSVRGPSERTGCYQWADGTDARLYGCTFDSGPDADKKGLHFTSPERLWKDAYIATF
jgi:hypothetical protein